MCAREVVAWSLNRTTMQNRYVGAASHHATLLIPPQTLPQSFQSSTGTQKSYLEKQTSSHKNCCGIVTWL